MSAGDNPDDRSMPLLDHLVELRQRLLIAVAAFVVCFAVSMVFAQDIFNFLLRPLEDLWEGETGRRLIYTHLAEQFFTQIKVALFTAAFFSFPIVAAQIWMFVAPGLYKQEKKAFLPFLVATPVLFFLGASLLYSFVLPLAWGFFAGFEQSGGAEQLPIVLEPKVNEYLSLVMQLIFAFGLAFELPVVLILLVRAGLVSVATLKRQRRYAVVFAFVAAAILTPPDPISQIGLALPIVLLYEISIIIASAWDRRRQKALDATG